MIGCAKFVDSSKTISVKVTDKKMLKSYTKIWKKISNLIDKKFDSGPIYEDSVKYIKAKIKTYGDKINTVFHNNKMPKQNVFH